MLEPFNSIIGTMGPEGTAREMDLGEFLEASMLPKSHAARIEYAVLNGIRNHPGRQWWSMTKRKLKRALLGWTNR